MPIGSMMLKYGSTLVYSMMIGDVITIHTHTTGNYKGTLKSYGLDSYVLRDVINHSRIHMDSIRIFVNDIKLIKLSQ